MLPPPAEKLQNFFGVFLQFQIGVDNLRKLSQIMHEMRVYAQKNGLKPSFCYYKQWGVKKNNGQGHRPVIPLRFSKSGAPEIERWYATHFVDSKRISELKTAKPETDQTNT